jgi:hypothetical protein
MEDFMKNRNTISGRLFLALLMLSLLLPVGTRAMDDAHFIQNDDYFISKEPYKAQTYIYVHLAKIKTPATPQTKGEAEFMQVGDGSEVWTKYYWTTRILSKEEIKLGLQVICFEGNSQEEIYQAPENKESARRDAWFIAKITDISDMYKGFVTVSGGYKIGLENMRVAATGK